MQIMIEIDDNLYTRLFDNGKNNVMDMRRACVAIRKGKPLPEGHGRLIDADELKKHKYHDSDRYENAVSIAQIDWQPTIIEADKTVIEKEVQFERIQRED